MSPISGTHLRLSCFGFSLTNTIFERAKKEHSVEECPLHFDIDGDGIPIFVEIRFRIFDDFIALIKGQPLNEERRGILADVHEPGDLGVADLAH